MFMQIRRVNYVCIHRHDVNRDKVYTIKTHDANLTNIERWFRSEGEIPSCKVEK